MLIKTLNALWQEAFLTGLATHGLIHALGVLPFVLFVWHKTHSFKSIFLLFVVIFLVDLDHLVDYFAYNGFSFSLLDFLFQPYFNLSQRVFVPLHAWEWAFLLGVLAKLRGWKSNYTVFGFGLLAHLIYDSLAVGSFLFYSIIYRALLGFTFS